MKNKAELIYLVFFSFMFIGNATAQTVPVAPSITSQPVSQTVTAGAQVSMAVAATGTAPLTYQWMVSVNGGPFTAMAGQTNPSRTTGAVVTANSGNRYECVVTNAAGSVTSNVATLTVNPAATSGFTLTARAGAGGLISPSGTMDVNSGSSQTFIIFPNANYTASLTVNGTAVTLTDNTYTLTNITEDDTVAASFSAKPPVITTQPLSQTGTVGGQATFTCAATGIPPVSYTWSVSVNGGPFVHFSQTPSSPLRTGIFTSADNGNRYECIATNSGGSVTSNPATLTVSPVTVPIITVPPLSQTVGVGTQPTFTISAVGNPAPSYQWQSSRGGAFRDISGATAPSYTTPSARFDNSGTQYQCVVSNSEGSAVSSTATLTVNAVSRSNPTDVWPPPVMTAYYVATNGDDENPGTLDAPFATLERAQTVMQGSSIKTTYLRAGFYPRTAILVLKSADNGETWMTYPGDPVDSAVLDGGGTTDIFWVVGGSNTTFNGLKIQNFNAYGVLIAGGLGVGPNVPAASGNTVENCDIGFNTITSWNSGAVAASGAAPSTTIINNFAHDLGSMGLVITSWFLASDSIEGGVIANNVVLRTVQRMTDGGAIYTGMRMGASQGIQGTAITIENNFVRDYGAHSVNWVHGIYLDDNSSNVMVRGNVVAPPAFINPLDMISGAFLIHNGNNNNITGNIIDVGNTGIYWTAIWFPGGEPVNFGMANNTFTNNVIVSEYTGSQGTNIGGHTGYSYYENDTAPNLPAIQNNVYYNGAGGQVNTEGPDVSDTNPVLEDPEISGVDYRIARGSPIYNAPVSFPAIVGGWGPPGFQVPGGAVQTAQTYPLTVSTAGNGYGEVFSSDGDINCGVNIPPPPDNCKDIVNAGTTVTLTATAATGSLFAGWTGRTCGGTGGCTLTMSEAKHVTAIFNLQTETITATAGTNGFISPLGSVTVNYGASRTFIITPKAGYTPVLVVDGSPATPVAIRQFRPNLVAGPVSHFLAQNPVYGYTFHDVTANHTIAVSFTKKIA